MQCPSCQHAETRVVDSRETGDCVRRRRECNQCNLRFTTFERVELRLPMVSKKDGRREPFDRNKLLTGIRLSCRKRPVSEEAIENVVSRIESNLSRRSDREIASEEIGKTVILELKDLDPVAYLRFASVYYTMGSPQDFAEVLRPLLDGK